MKRILLAVALLIPLGGCTTLRQVIGDQATQDAMQAAKIAMTAYADVYQPAVLAYGYLPVCGSEGAPVLCKNPAVFANLKTVDAKTTAAIDKAKAIVDDGAPDNGEIAAAQARIQEAAVAIGASGALAITHGGQP